MLVDDGSTLSKLGVIRFDLMGLRDSHGKTLAERVAGVGLIPKAPEGSKLVFGQIWTCRTRWMWGERFQAEPREENLDHGARFVPVAVWSTPLEAAPDAEPQKRAPFWISAGFVKVGETGVEICGSALDATTLADLFVQLFTYDTDAARMSDALNAVSDRYVREKKAVAVALQLWQVAEDAYRATTWTVDLSCMAIRQNGLIVFKAAQTRFEREELRCALDDMRDRGQIDELTWKVLQKQIPLSEDEKRWHARKV